MIQSFVDAGTEDVFNGRPTRAGRRACPATLLAVARRKLDQLDQLDQLDATVSLAALRVPPGNQLEALKGDRQGQHSIRINDQYRVRFRWTDAGPADVESVDYHRATPE